MAIETLPVNELVNTGLLESKLKDKADTISGGKFGSVLTEVLGATKKENISINKDKAVDVAQLIKLEMMRSCLSLGEINSEPGQGKIEKKIKLILKYFDDYRQQNVTSKEVPSSPVSPVLPVQSQGGSGLDSIIDKASKTYGIDPALIRAVIKAESNFNPRAVSSAGAQGLMQLMPSTASGLGVTNSFDPEQNVMAGTKFLKQMMDRYGGNLNSALAAYNWGPGNLEKKGGALPRETREYLTKVKKYFAENSA
jgi:hypothetical protein